MRDIFVGSFAATGATVNVVCGFIPQAVIMFGVGVAPLIQAHTLDREVTTGPDFKPVITDTAIGVEPVTPSVISGDVVIYDEDEGNTQGQGFSVVAANALNVNGETVSFIALRGDR